MKTKKEIVCEVDDLTFGWFDPETEEFHILEDIDDEKAQDLIKRDDFRERLIEALGVYNIAIVDMVGTELKSIWKRLDQIEERLNKG